MKTPTRSTKRNGGHGSPYSKGAFVLTDVVISMALLIVLFAGLIGIHFFGMKMFELTRVKLGVNQDGRVALSALIEEIRRGKSIRVGTGGHEEFSAVPVNQPQMGNALQIYADNDTNSYVRYFWDVDQTLRRMTNNASTDVIIAQAVTNRIIFKAENFAGQVLTNHQNNRVIGVTLQFAQLQYPAVSIGPGQYYDHYRLSTRVTRRAIE